MSDFESQILHLPEMMDAVTHSVLHAKIAEVSGELSKNIPYLTKAFEKRQMQEACYCLYPFHYYNDTQC